MKIIPKSQPIENVVLYIPHSDDVRSPTSQYEAIFEIVYSPRHTGPPIGIMYKAAMINIPKSALVNLDISDHINGELLIADSMFTF
jgi:hypothetical protein